MKLKVKNRKKEQKSRSNLKSQISSNSNSTSKMSCESNGHCKEYDCYNRIVVDKLRDNSKYEIKRIYKKYRLSMK